jgi:hypothetical protein
MTDDTKDVAGQDRNRINLSQGYDEARNWAKSHGVPEDQPALAADLPIDYEHVLTSLELWRAVARMANQEELRLFRRDLEYLRGEGPIPTESHRKATDRLRRLAAKSFDSAMLAQDLFARRQRAHLAARTPKPRCLAT